jgi:type IV pilus assembly protein PilW
MQANYVDKTVISLQNINSKVLSRQRGVSLVELLVALLLGLFLLYALVEILVNGKQSFSSASHMSRLQENGRVATNLVVTDLKRAGYLGGNSYEEDIYGSTGKQTPSMTCATGDTTWGRMTDWYVSGLDDTNAGYACIPNGTYLRGDILTVRYAAPWAAASLSANKMYLRSSLFQGKIFDGSNAGSLANVVDDEPNSVRELMAYSYFVGDSGRTCGGQIVPSLFRVRLDDSSRPLAEELLPGVEDLQVQYGTVAEDALGTAISGRYQDADDVNNWTNVTSVRIWLLVRAECTETGFTDNSTYNLGNKTYTPGDNFRRQLYSSAVMIRN